MTKFKINTVIAATALLAGILAGWDTFLIITVLILLFCEMNDNLKNVMIRIITFFLALTFFTLVWNLIVDGISLIPNLIEQLVSLINNYLTEQINIYKLEAYLFKPILEITSIANTVVSYLLMFVKFSFVIAILRNKPMKENFIIKKINDFVRKIIGFLNGIDVSIQQLPVMNQQVSV